MSEGWGYTNVPIEGWRSLLVVAHNRRREAVPALGYQLPRPHAEVEVSKILIRRRSDGAEVANRSALLFVIPRRAISHV